MLIASYSDGAMSSGSGEQQACLRAASARSLVSVLHSIKPANTKQVPGMIIWSIGHCISKYWRVCTHACMHCCWSHGHTKVAERWNLVQAQECVLLIGPEDGLSVRLEDESKTLQSSIFMRPDVRRLLLLLALDVACKPCQLDDWSELVSIAGLSVCNADSVVSCSLQLFSAVHCPGGRQIFGVQFGLLLDTLQALAIQQTAF